MKKNIIETSRVIILGLVLSLGVAYVSAYSTWAPPTALPPGNNADTPINVSNIAQFKNGPLTIGGGVVPSASYKLNVPGLASFTGIVTQAFTLTTGAGLNKVLTSDADGVASWGNTFVVNDLGFEDKVICPDSSWITVGDNSIGNKWYQSIAFRCAGGYLTGITQGKTLADIPPAPSPVNPSSVLKYTGTNGDYTTGRPVDTLQLVGDDSGNDWYIFYDGTNNEITGFVQIGGTNIIPSDFPHDKIYCSLGTDIRSISTGSGGSSVTLQCQENQLVAISKKTSFGTFTVAPRRVIQLSTP